MSFLLIKRYDETRDMIMCDYCGDWYHYDCVGIDDVLAKGIDTYKCQVCISKGMDELMYEEEHPQKRALELAFGEQQERKELLSFIVSPAYWTERQLQMSTIGGNQNSCFFYASVPGNVMTTIPSSIWPELSTKTD